MEHGRLPSELTIVGDRMTVDFRKLWRPDGWYTITLFAILGAFVATWVPVQSDLGPGFRDIAHMSVSIWDSLLLSDKFYEGQVWRAVTYMFLHQGFEHLFYNVLGLVALGIYVQSCFAGHKTTLVFFVGGVVGGLLHLCCAGTPVVGASGGLMALLGALLSANVRYLFAPNRTRTLRQAAAVVLLVGLVIRQIGVDQQSIFIAGWAHIGGMVAGAVLGACLTLKSNPALLAKRPGCLSVVVVGGEACTTFQLNSSFDPAHDSVVYCEEEIGCLVRLRRHYRVIAGITPEYGDPVYLIAAPGFIIRMQSFGPVPA